VKRNVRIKENIIDIVLVMKNVSYLLMKVNVILLKIGKNIMGFVGDVNMDLIPKKDVLEGCFNTVDKRGGSSNPTITALFNIAMIEKLKKELIKEPEPLNAIQRRLNAIDD